MVSSKKLGISKKTLILTLLIFIFLVVVVYSINVFSGYFSFLFSATPIEDSCEDPVLICTPNDLAGLTKKMVYMSHAYTNLPAQEKPIALDVLRKTVESRQELLLKIMDKNPSEARKYMLSSELVEKIPKNIRNLVEEKVQLVGDIEMIQIDYFEEGKSENINFLILNDSRRLRLYSEKPEKHYENLLPKSKVMVNGFKIKDTVLLDESNGDNPIKVFYEPVVEETPLVQKKMAVMLVNFLPNPQTPHTIEYIRSSVFTAPISTNAYIKEVSFNKMGLIGYLNPDGDVFGYFTLDSGLNCSSNYNKWSTQVNNLAAAQGFNVNNYDYVAYVFYGASDCKWSGVGQLGGKYTWHNGFRISTMTHELGHNLGLLHASSYSCNEEGTRVTLSSNCTHSEYGDPFDVMGSSSGMKHFNAFYKTGSRALYIPKENILNVSKNGIYNISTLERESNMHQLLMIKRPGITDTSINYIYVEVRERFGFDNFADNSPPLNGIFIRLGSHSVSRNTYLLDSTPQTSTFSDSPFLVGHIFNDTLSGISVTLLSRTVSNATILVSFDDFDPVCVRSPPTVTWTPTSQWAYPGDIATYTLSVKNSDSIGCDKSTFNTIITLPEGLRTSPSTFNFELEPQSTWTSQVKIQTSADIQQYGTYQFSASSINVNSSKSGSASATLNIYKADNEPPIITITKPTDMSTVPSRGTLSISAAAVDDSGVLNMVILVGNNVVKTCNKGYCSVNVKVNQFVSGQNIITVRATDSSINRNVAYKSIIVYR